jgi:hypothetical protein
MTKQQETPIKYEKLLRGYYEAGNLPKDFSPDRIVPDFGFNVLNMRGLLYTPIIDERYLDSGGRKPSWPDGKSFAVCLTHDVDVVSLYSLRESLRARWSQIKKNPSLLKKIENLLGLSFDWFRYIGGKDPIHCYELWIKVESEINACSTFFFWPGIKSIMKPHQTDCRYNLRDTITFNGQKCTVAEMIKEIDKNSWEIGLHSSWYSFNDADEMKRQKEALANVVKHDIVSVRQHYLHYDIRVTPNIHYEAGLKYDSTLGFNDNVGFRFGTCYPWHLYDLEGEKDIPVLEIPLIIQDTAMLNPVKGMRLDEDTAFKYIKQITETVVKVGGVLTLLWHPNRILDPGWWNLYLRTLRYLKEKDAWFGTIQEIGRWWEAIKTGQEEVKS